MPAPCVQEPPGQSRGSESEYPTDTFASEQDVWGPRDATLSLPPGIPCDIVVPTRNPMRHCRTHPESHATLSLPPGIPCDIVAHTQKRARCLGTPGCDIVAVDDRGVRHCRCGRPRGATLSLWTTEGSNTVAPKDRRLGKQQQPNDQARRHTTGEHAGVPLPPVGLHAVGGCDII